jgi:exosortase
LTADRQSTFSGPWLFAAWMGAVLGIFHSTLIGAIRFGLHNDDASHILLIPFLSSFLIYFERHRIFQAESRDRALGIALGLVATVIAVGGVWRGMSPELPSGIELYLLSVVIFTIAGFALFFGKSAVEGAKVPLLLLLLMIPMPEVLRIHAVHALQTGSAAIVNELFEWTGVPFLREGLVFHLSSVSIEVAEECSGIRSSMAVLILALVAARFYLRTFWRQLLFVIASLFIMIVKNGIRIATLTLLSVYVNPSFLFGRLHHDGGVVFFLFGLILLAPVLWVLKRTENAKASVSAVENGRAAQVGS